jgi:large subunit ribosomal protein L16
VDLQGRHPALQGPLEDKISKEAAMAVGETVRRGAPRKVVSSGRARRREAAPPGARPVGRGRPPPRAEPLIKEADPEFERLLAEEEEIERSPASTTRPRTSVPGTVTDMLMPKKVKHRKHHRGRTKGKAKGGTSVTFGEYGIQALEPGWITARQIEAARIAMTRHIKRGGKVWINVFPDKPVTEKPAETRMGSGKGNPERWVAVVKPGRILFELSYPTPRSPGRPSNRAIQKLPIKARFVTREEAL